MSGIIPDLMGNRPSFVLNGIQVSSCKTNRSADYDSDTPDASSKLGCCFRPIYGQLPSALGAGVRIVSVTSAFNSRVGPMNVDMKGMKTL